MYPSNYGQIGMSLQHQSNQSMLDPNLLRHQMGQGERGGTYHHHFNHHQDSHSMHGHVFRTPTISHETPYRLVHVRQTASKYNCSQLSQLPVTAACFDQQELLWAGTQRGTVSSYYGMHFNKYTAFHVSTPEDTAPEVRQILTVDEGVLALTSTHLRFNLRTGPPSNCFTDPDMQQMQCMIQTGSDSIMTGGQQRKAIEWNICTSQVVNKYDMDEDGCVVFKQTGKYVCSGDSGGKVTLYDAKSMKKQHVLQAHSAYLSDFDVQGHLLVTCGLSARQDSHLLADRFLMVFDMRVMRAMAPIQVSLDPTFLRFIPALSNHLVVVSQLGSFQVTDTTAMSPTMMMYPIETHGGLISSFDISETCQAMVFGNTTGYLQLYANSENAVFSGHNIPTVFADRVDPVKVQMPLSDDLCFFAQLPTFYQPTGSLLSEWPVGMTKKVIRKPNPIDPEILRSATIMHDIQCVPNPGTFFRNQISYKMSEDVVQNHSLSNSDTPIGNDLIQAIPKEYQRMLMIYTKLDNFDFRHYNKTFFAGLTAEYNNSYCNSILLVLYFVEPLRVALLSHICQQHFCLACELGFLFHMLDNKKGEACQAKNFQRAFRTLTEAAALGLLVQELEPISDLAIRTPRLHRFLIQQIDSELGQGKYDTCDSCLHTDDASSISDVTHQEEPVASEMQDDNFLGKLVTVDRENSAEDSSDGKDAFLVVKETSYSSAEESVADGSSVMKDLFFIKYNFTLVCRCGQEMHRVEQPSIAVLQYPQNPQTAGTHAVHKMSFAEVLQSSLTSNTTLQTWCTECQKYQMHIKKRMLTALPDILSIDCNLDPEANRKFWHNQIEILKTEGVHGDAAKDDGMATSRQKCRYGSSCVRTDCRYFHGHDENGMSSSMPGDKGCTTPQDPSWLPSGFKAQLLPDGNLTVHDVSAEDESPRDTTLQVDLYELYAIVYVIKQECKGDSHLVSCVNVREPYHQRKEGVTCSQWYLVNDFLFKPVDKPENLWVDLRWKVPSLVYFTRWNYLCRHQSTVTNWSRPDLLYNDSSLVNPHLCEINHLPLRPEENLSKGDLVGLDAEFISLKEEEAELRSDGTKSTITPSHVSPARITCVRGQGLNVGQPFIDDYILTPEQVSDYLTEFSGIKSSELDPDKSTKHLTTLKSTYQKLRCLLAMGVVFVGHGLQKDFKVINMQVPMDQIVDTVQLFHLPNKRFVSLRFLAKFFLEVNIHSGMHDSAEDARIALLLYQKYREMKLQGDNVLMDSIHDLYETGRRVRWKVSDVHSGVLHSVGLDLNDPNIWFCNQDSEDDLLDLSATYFES